MFTMTCTACKKDVDPVLDEKDKSEPGGVVVCPMCGEPMTNVSSFIKVQLKSFSQVRKTVVQQKAYAIKCSSCSATVQPKIKGKDFLCTSCGKAMNISEAFKNLIRENVKKSDV